MINIGEYIDKYKGLINELHEMNIKLKSDSEKFSNELSEIDREVSDYEHYIELVDCDDATKINIFNDFHKTLCKRRVIKENIAEAKFITEQLNSKLYKSSRSGGLYDSVSNFATNRKNVKYVAKIRTDLQDNYDNNRYRQEENRFTLKNILRMIIQ